MREMIEEEIAIATAGSGVELDIPIGTMIELPRAALTAGEIAGVADFFSFGTNDLTQMTYGLSRDDAEGCSSAIIWSRASLPPTRSRPWIGQGLGVWCESRQGGPGGQSGPGGRAVRGARW